MLYIFAVVKPKVLLSKQGRMKSKTINAVAQPEYFCGYLLVYK